MWLSHVLSAIVGHWLYVVLIFISSTCAQSVPFLLFVIFLEVEYVLGSKFQTSKSDQLCLFCQMSQNDNIKLEHDFLSLMSWRLVENVSALVLLQVPHSSLASKDAPLPPHDGVT